MGVPLSMLGQVDFTAFQSCIPSVYVVPGEHMWIWGICGSVCEGMGSGGIYMWGVCGSMCEEMGSGGI